MYIVKLLFPVIIVGLLLAACVPVTQPARETSETASPVMTRPCDVYLPRGEVEGKTILCGTVDVPWDRTNPAAGTAQIATVILKATGDNPQPDPIVHISGGPGAGATLRDVVPEMVKRYAPLRVDHDIILYDQRGAGHSQPFFACPYPDEAASAALTPELAQQFGRPPTDAEIQSAYCARDWAERGFPTTDVSTQANAADLADLMTALGYPAYNLYGISYGTRLAMALMHYFPDDAHVRSVVLDSPYPLPEDKVNDYSAAPLLDQWALFEAVFQACADDPACVSAYPKLRARFDALVTRLDATPIDLGDGQTFGGGDLYRMVYPFNHALNFIAYQPRLIAELERGDTTTLTLLRSGMVPARTVVTGAGPDVEGFSALLDAYMACASGQDGTSSSDEALLPLWDAEVKTVQAYIAAACPGDKATTVNALLDKLAPGAFNGIVARFAPEQIQAVNSALNSKISCTEQYPFREEPQAVEAALTKVGLPAFFREESLAAMAGIGEGCSGWPDALTAPTLSSYGGYPVLILNGQFDSVTPPQLGQIAAGELPAAQLVVVPNAMHSILGNHGACPTQIVQQFLAAPGQPVDTRCTEEMRVAFVAPDAELPTLENATNSEQPLEGGLMPPIPETEQALVLRTDFSDDGTWKQICDASQRPVGEFQANVACLSDPAYDGAGIEQIVAAIPQGWNHSYLFVADAMTMKDPEHPILCVDLLDTPGRSFRVIPAQMWSVENNLSLGNMDFAEFANAVDQKGIFRGFP